MLEEIVTDTRTYKFGTTDLEFSLCMNKEHDDQGVEKGDCYIVESLRDEDCLHLLYHPGENLLFDFITVQKQTVNL